MTSSVWSVRDCEVPSILYWTNRVFLSSSIFISQNKKIEHKSNKPKLEACNSGSTERDPVTAHSVEKSLILL